MCTLLNQRDDQFRFFGYLIGTVKSFHFVGTKLSGFTMIDMFMDTWICGFQIILNIIKVNKYFVGILNLWIVLPSKYSQLNVQWIKMISQSF